MDFTEVSKNIANQLIKNGWKQIKFSSKLPNASGTFDVIAQTKGIRKKMLVISIGADPNDATIAGMLLNGIENVKCDKYIFLLSGDPRFVHITSDIKIITDIFHLPLP